MPQEKGKIKHSCSITHATWIIALTSLLALVVSIMALFRAEQARQTAEKERLYIRIQRYDNDYLTKVYKIRRPPGEPDSPPLIDTYWECLLVNNGIRTLSIISYRIANTDNADSNEDIGYYQTVYQEPGVSVELPLQIEPGHTKLFLLRFGFPVMEKTYKVLQNSPDYPSFNSVSEIEQYLVSKGTGIQGEEVLATGKAEKDGEIWPFTIRSQGMHRQVV